MAFRRLLCLHSSYVLPVKYPQQCVEQIKVRYFSRYGSSVRSGSKPPDPENNKSTAVPGSFDMINNFPLIPSQEKDWYEESIDFKMDVEQLNLRSLPSVKTILNKTMTDESRGFLDRWRQNMIKEVGEKGLQDYMTATIANGKNFHNNIYKYLQGTPEEDLKVKQENEGHWESVQHALKSIGDLKACEVDIMHSNLLYKGVFDCIGRYKDVLCLIDWKTSKTPRPLLKFTYDDPLQVVAYMGAINSDPYYKSKYGELKHGMLVVAYPSGEPAHVHLMNSPFCEHYWRQWRSRLYDYFELCHKQTIEAGGFG